MNAPGHTASCSYCGLPLSTGRWFRRTAPEPQLQNPIAELDSLPSDAPSTVEPVYCCSGCRFAAEVTAESQIGAAINRPVARLGIAIFLTVNVVMFSMVLWSDDVYTQETTVVGHTIAEHSRASQLLSDAFRWLSLLLSAGVVWLLAGPLAQNAWQEIRRAVAAVDMLLLVGIGAAFVYSVASVLRGSGHIYFEVTCVVLVLVTLGRWLESLGKIRAAGAIHALSKLLPDQVRRWTGEHDELMPLSQLCRGDTIRVLPGERIAADGRITCGSASIDEQLLTGESRSIVKHPGDTVLGGTLNLDGVLHIEVDSDAGHGTIGRMVDSLRRAQLVRGRYQQLADRVAAWFLPATLVIACAAVYGHTATSGWENGILAGMAVLLIACPCALGLATPLAVWTALGRASQHQVLVRHGDALERLAAARTIVFDKTGTLTSGDATVAELLLAEGEDRVGVLHRAASLTTASTHPYSAAIAKFARAQLCDEEETHHGPSGQPAILQNDSFGNDPPVRLHPGKGITRIDPRSGSEIVLGSQQFMRELGLTVPAYLAERLEEFQRLSPSWVMIGWDESVHGIFVIDEEIRCEASPAMLELQTLGLDVHVLSGDRPERAAEFSQLLGVPAEGGLLPEDKVERIDRLRARHGPVAMVGDGLNDATALAAADVGIAMGCGVDVSREAADFCLLGNDLSRIPWSISLARQTVRVIRQNLFWSFAYNSLGMALAVSGRLNPIWAALAMMFSSFFVVANSLRIGAGETKQPQSAHPLSESHLPGEVVMQPAHPGNEWINQMQPSEFVETH